MRLSYATVFLAVAGLAACGPPSQQDAVVKFSGSAPNTSLQKAKGDNREITTWCPTCRQSIDPSMTACRDKKNCGTKITWNGPFPCGSCKGSGRCSACYWMERLPSGDCSNCQGKGEKIYLGKRADCPDCKGKGKCSICQGSKNCDYCAGAGKLSYDLVKEKAKKVKASDEDDSSPAPKKEPAMKAPEKPAEEKK